MIRSRMNLSAVCRVGYRGRPNPQSRLNGSRTNSSKYTFSRPRSTSRWRWIGGRFMASLLAFPPTKNFRSESSLSDADNSLANGLKFFFCQSHSDIFLSFRPIVYTTKTRQGTSSLRWDQCSIRYESFSGYCSY